MTDNKKQQAEIIAENLSNFVNGMDNESMDYLIKKMLNDHGTLQQRKFRLVLRIVEAYADPNFRTDPRNEYSHSTAKEIVSSMEKQRGYEWRIIANCPLI